MVTWRVNRSAAGFVYLVGEVLVVRVDGMSWAGGPVACLCATSPLSAAAAGSWVMLRQACSLAGVLVGRGAHMVRSLWQASRGGLGAEGREIPP
jgi:hypothetical protein